MEHSNQNTKWIAGEKIPFPTPWKVSQQFDNCPRSFKLQSRVSVGCDKNKGRFKKRNSYFLPILLTSDAGDNQGGASPPPPPIPERMQREGHCKAMNVKEIKANINMSWNQRFHNSHRWKGGAPIKWSMKMPSVSGWRELSTGFPWLVMER